VVKTAAADILNVVLAGAFRARTLSQIEKPSGYRGLLFFTTF
jgi:hypothetical protein